MSVGIFIPTTYGQLCTMHHALIVFTLIVIQGHRDLNLDNNTCSFFPETVQAIPITFAVKIVRRKVNIFFSRSDDFNLSFKVTIAPQT